MAEPAPVLIICSTFPPCRGIGGRRWAKYAKALAARGHAVHVVHAACTKDQEGSLWTADVQHERIHAHPLPPHYPAVLAKRPLTTVPEKLAYRFWRFLLPRLVNGNWLDRSVRWKEPMLAACDTVIRTHGIRHVIASGAPFHLLAHALELRTRFPDLRLVADLRDPWTWGDTYGMKHLAPGRMAHERAMEQAVVAGYDRVIAPAQGILDHLAQAYGAHAHKLALLPHPVDPDDLVSGPALPRDRHFRLIYAGSLYATALFRSYLDQVIAAFHHVRRIDPPAFDRARFDLYVLGEDVRPFNDTIEQAGLADKIRFHPPLPAKALYAELQRADVVLVFLPPEKKDILTTKFNELFLLRVPVLHVGLPGVVSRTITDGGHGSSIGPDAVATALPAVIRGERPVRVTSTAGTDELLLAPLCDRLEALLFTAH